MLVFQLDESGDKTQIYLERSTPRCAEPHVRHLRVSIKSDAPLLFQEYHWKVGYWDDLRSETTVKLYFMELEEDNLFHVMSVPLEDLAVVGYYTKNLAPL
jgi:hypothetical protein